MSMATRRPLMSDQSKVTNIVKIHPPTVKEVLYECLLPSIARKHGLYGPAACSAILAAAKLLQKDIDRLASLPPEPEPEPEPEPKAPPVRAGRPSKTTGRIPTWHYILRLLHVKPLTFPDLSTCVVRARKKDEQPSVQSSTVRASLTLLCQGGYAKKTGRKSKGRYGHNRVSQYALTTEGYSYALVTRGPEIKENHKGVRSKESLQLKGSQGTKTTTEKEQV